MADWTQLLHELLLDVSRRLTLNIDFIRFRAVCVSWRRATSERPLHLPCQFPLLMLPHEENTDMQGFFSLSSNKTCYVELLETRQKRCCGSSGGWLVLLDETPDVCLFNPLTKAQIQLPPLTTFPDVLAYQPSEHDKEFVLRDQFYEEDPIMTFPATKMRDLFIRKAVLSSSPDSGADCIVMVILRVSLRLAFCRLGDETWTVIDRKLPCYDVIYYKGQFYSISCPAKVAICNLTPSPEVVLLMDDMIRPGKFKYLVESGGELLLVVRHDAKGEYAIYRTCKFDVFKIEMSGPLKITRLECLGDCALFLGPNHSLSFSTTNFPGCKGNHIYFTDDDCSEGCNHGHYTGNDVGIFNLEDGTIEPVPSCPANDVLIWPAAVWFTPSLY